VSPAVTLRPARSTDAADIAEVFLAAHRHSLSYLPDLHTDDETRSWIRNTVLPNTTVWVAESAGAVVAFLSVEQKMLEHLYVHPSFHSQGIGTALLDKAFELAPGGLKLYTFARNEVARRFYERRGFRAIAFGDDNEQHEPDVLYEWVSPSTDDTETG
jgi:GNAT superfamily N-acetyltransferase